MRSLQPVLVLNIACMMTEVAAFCHLICNLARAVGGVVGFALVYKGASAVIWAGRTDSFPYFTGACMAHMAALFTDQLSTGVQR